MGKIFIAERLAALEADVAALSVGAGLTTAGTGLSESPPGTVNLSAANVTKLANTTNTNSGDETKSNLTPIVASTGAAGASAELSRADHVHPAQTTVSGLAGTATALATARAINGTNFDGTAAITVTAAAGTLTGATLNSGVTASSLTSVGTLTSLTSSGQIEAASFLHDVAAPSAPSAGALLFAKTRGRTAPWARGPLDVGYALQPCLGGSRVSILKVAAHNQTTLSVFGFPTLTTNGASATNAAFATTNIVTASARLTYPSASGAGSTGGWRFGSTHWWRGNAAGLGGFYYVHRFALSTIPATRRWFVGFTDATTAFGNADYSTLTNLIGVGQDVADTTIQFMHNDGSGSCTKSNSAIGSPTTSELLEVCIYAAPNASDVYLTVEKLNGGAAVVAYNPSTNLPSSTTALTLQSAFGNASTAAVIGADFVSYYVESDY